MQIEFKLVKIQILRASIITMLFYLICTIRGEKKIFFLQRLCKCIPVCNSIYLNYGSEYKNAYLKT